MPGKVGARLAKTQWQLGTGLCEGCISMLCQSCTAVPRQFKATRKLMITIAGLSCTSNRLLKPGWLWDCLDGWACKTPWSRPTNTGRLSCASSAVPLGITQHAEDRAWTYGRMEGFWDGFGMEGWEGVGTHTWSSMIFMISIPV